MWSRLSATEGFKRLAMQALVVLDLVVLGSGLVMAFYYIPLPDVGFDSRWRGRSRASTWS